MKTLLPIIVFSLCAFAAAGQNKVAFKANRHDFGTVDRKKEAVIEAAFEITNTGQAPLVIYKVDVSCGCITSSYPDKPLKKGETGYVRLRLDVAQLGSSFNKTAFVKTNAPDDKGVLLLRVTGKVK